MVTPNLRPIRSARRLAAVALVGASVLGASSMAATAALVPKPVTTANTVRLASITSTDGKIHYGDAVHISYSLKSTTPADRTDIVTECTVSGFTFLVQSSGKLSWPTAAGTLTFPIATQWSGLQTALATSSGSCTSSLRLWDRKDVTNTILATSTVPLVA